VEYKDMKKKIMNEKIECLDLYMKKEKMKMGIKVIINEKEKMDGIRKRE
jgi:hypothetical protein